MAKVKIKSKFLQAGIAGLELIVLITLIVGIYTGTEAVKQIRTLARCGGNVI